MSFLSWILPILALTLSAVTIGYIIAWMIRSKDLKQLKDKLDQHEKKSQALAQTHTQTEIYAKSLQSDKVRLATLNDELNTDLARLKLKLNNANLLLTRQQNDRQSFQDNIGELKSQNDILVEKTKDLQQELEQCQSRQQDAEKQHHELQQELQHQLKSAEASHQSLVEELTALKVLQASDKKRSEKLETELKNEKDSISSENERLKTELSNAIASCENLSTQHQTALEEMTLNDKSNKEELEDRMAELERQTAQKDHLQQKNLSLLQRNQQLEHALELAAEEIKNCRTDCAQIQETIDSYKNKNLALNQLLNEMREEMQILHLQMDADRIPNRSKAQDAQLELKKALGKRIKKVTPSQKDDLKRIRGLGPFVEKKLNRFGIFSFEQITQFDEELINTVTDALQFFPGRIEEDDWVGQASDLLNIKLNNPADFIQNPKETRYGKNVPSDNLKIIEGIGPKIENILKEAGIENWNMLAQTKPGVLRNILDEAGSQYKLHNPGSWPKQARLAHLGKWEALIKLQDQLFRDKK